MHGMVTIIINHMVHFMLFEMSTPLNNNLKLMMPIFLIELSLPRLCKFENVWV